MKAKDVMKTASLKSCSLNTKVSSVANTMKKTNLGALPVVDKDQRVIGIITDRDICLSLAKTGKPSSEISIKEILQKAKIRTVKSQDQISVVLRKMRKNKIGRLPVTDNEGKLKGVISVNTILTRAIKKNEAIGKLKSKDENLAKTIKALFDRNGSASKTKKEVLETKA